MPTATLELFELALKAVDLLLIGLLQHQQPAYLSLTEVPHEFVLLF